MQEENIGNSVLYAPSTLANGRAIPMKVLGRKQGVKNPKISMLAIWDAGLVAEINGKKRPSKPDLRPTSFANLAEFFAYFAQKGKYVGKRRLMAEWEGKNHILDNGAVVSSEHEGDDRWVNEIRISWPKPEPIKLNKLTTKAQKELISAIKANVPFGFVSASNFVSLCRAVGIDVQKRAKTDEIKAWGDSCIIEGVCTLVGFPIISGGRSTKGKGKNYLKLNHDEMRAQIEKAKKKGIDIAQLVK